MNNNEYILNQEIKNRRILLKMYNKQAFKIKKQLFEAYEAKRSTHYLESLLASVNKEIDTLDKFFAEYAKRQTKESYINGVKQADNGFRQLTFFDGVSTSAIAFGQANIEAIKVLARETYVPLNKLTKTMARDCREYLKRENFETTESALKQLNKLVDSETLRKIGIEGVSDVVVGNKTWQQGMRNIKEEFLRQSDFKVPYYKKDGTLSRLVPIEDYAKMVARTTTAHIMREGTKDRILDTFGDDGDLVEVIGHSEFPDSPCIPYEGKILSLTGNTPKELTDKLGSDYMGLYDDAVAKGLNHPNCIHTFGVSDRIKELYDSQYDKDEIQKLIDEAKGKTTEENTSTDHIAQVGDMVEENKRSNINNFREIEEQAKIEVESYQTTEEIAQKIANLGEFVHGVDLGGMPKNIADEFYITAEKVFTKYPQLKGGSGIKMELLDSNIYADNMSFITAIHLNSQHFKDFNTLTKLYERDVDLGYHPINTSFRSILTHELGHSLHSYIEINYGKSPTDIKREVLKLAGIKNSAKEVKEKLSEYATKNTKEFFAEAFTEYLESQKPRKIAKTFGKYIDGILNN